MRDTELLVSYLHQEIWDHRHVIARQTDRLPHITHPLARDIAVENVKLHRVCADQWDRFLVSQGLPRDPVTQTAVAVVRSALREAREGL